MAKVSDDHADVSLCVDKVKTPTQCGPRPISSQEMKEHDGSKGGDFWAVVDGFVVDASEFIKKHPGGAKKLLSADDPDAGATGKSYGFSFSRGRNAHFPETGKNFHDGVQKYLRGKNNSVFLPPAEVTFPPHGKLMILGKLA